MPLTKQQKLNAYNNALIELNGNCRLECNSDYVCVILKNSLSYKFAFRITAHLSTYEIIEQYFPELLQQKEEGGAWWPKGAKLSAIEALEKAIELTNLLPD